jgi:hypothetical protein
VVVEAVFRRRQGAVFLRRREVVFRRRREVVFRRRRGVVFLHHREVVFRRRGVVFLHHRGVVFLRRRGVFRHRLGVGFRHRHQEGSCMGVYKLKGLHPDMLEEFLRRQELSTPLREAGYLGHQSPGAGLLHREVFDQGETHLVRLRPVRVDPGFSLAALRMRAQSYAERRDDSFWGHEGYELLALAWGHIQRACAERIVWPGA